MFILNMDKYIKYVKKYKMGGAEKNTKLFTKDVLYTKDITLKAY